MVEFDANCYSIIITWLSFLTKDQFENLVNIFKEVVKRILNLIQQGQNLKDYLKIGLKVLRLFYLAYSNNPVSKISYEDFYIPQVKSN